VLVTNSKLEKTIATLKLQQSDLEESSNYAIEQLKIKLAGATQELGSCEGRIAELESKLRYLQEASEISGRGKSDSEDSLAQALEDKAQLEEELADKDKALLQLKEEVNKINLRAHKESMELAAELERRTSELQKKDAQLRECKLKCEEKEARARVLQQELELCGGRLEGCQREAKRAAAELEHLRQARSSNAEVVAQLKKELECRGKQLACLNEWKSHNQQVRSDLGTLRLETRQSKQSEIDRIDELINEIGVKHLRKRF
jgi:chromosome segregation ATPase